MRPFPVLTLMSMIRGSGGYEIMEGFGKDIKSLGESIEKKASDSDD